MSVPTRANARPFLHHPVVAVYSYSGVPMEDIAAGWASHPFTEV
jgi:hypothetical protein